MKMFNHLNRITTSVSNRMFTRRRCRKQAIKSLLASVKVFKKLRMMTDNPTFRKKTKETLWKDTENIEHSRGCPFHVFRSIIYNNATPFSAKKFCVFNILFFDRSRQKLIKLQYQVVYKSENWRHTK